MGSSMASLNTAFSGLKAAQAGLYVTGHNMSNSENVGYVRQRVLQYDFTPQGVGVNSVGMMQVGLGTDINSINQIRNKYLDVSYREKISQASYYGAKYSTGLEIQDILGELDGAYRLQTAFTNFWNSLHELKVKPQGLETRENFIASAWTLIDKVSNAYNTLHDYQQDLDLQIRDSVTEVNQLVSRIKEFNLHIKTAEIPGDSANDYRDERNNCLDRLSELLDITYEERADGSVDIAVGDHDLLVNGHQNTIGLRYTAPGYNFVEPVFTTSTEILKWDDPASPVYKLTGTISSTKGNDTGGIKGLLVSRGSIMATYATEPVKPNENDPKYDGTGSSDSRKNHPQYKADYLQYEKDLFNVTQCMIPKVMKDLDTIVHTVVMLVNEAFAPVTYKPDTINSGVYLDKNGDQFELDADGNPVYTSASALLDGQPVPAENIVYVKDTGNAPYDLTGAQSFQEIFSRKTVDRFTGDTYNGEDPSDINTLYSIINLQLNPIFRGEDGGMNYIATSLSGDLEDSRLLDQLIKDWNKLGIDTMYSQFITDIGIVTKEAQTNAESLNETATQLDANRAQVSSVSLDEEMQNMLRYQHAYNAAARMVNVIDSILDKIINGTGRVGL